MKTITAVGIISMGKGRRGPQGQGGVLAVLTLALASSSWISLGGSLHCWRQDKVQQLPLTPDFQEVHAEGDSLGRQPETPSALCNPNFCPHGTATCSPIWFSIARCHEGMSWCVLFCLLFGKERVCFLFPSEIWWWPTEFRPVLLL